MPIGDNKGGFIDPGFLPLTVGPERPDLPGTLWATGYNLNGQVGNSYTTNYSSPVQVGSLTTWLNVAAGFYHSLGTTTDNKLYAWGYNGAGQMGIGDQTNRSSPVQVGAETTWGPLPKMTKANSSVILNTTTT